MILMNDFKLEPEALIQAELKGIERVIRSGWYILGNELKKFESEWVKKTGATYCVGVGNGMDAIEIGLRSSGIGIGDEIITTALTAFATVLAIIRAGATPVIADIDMSTGLLDPESVRRCITDKTKGILLVHLYGQIRQMDVWNKLCKEFKLLLFEDCAQSHMAKWNGQNAGSHGEWGAYSFYPTKNLGALGDGGALICSNSKIDTCARKLRNYGQEVRYYHSELGLNSRLDEMQAALLSARLNWLDEYTALRKAVAQRYHSEIVNSNIALLSIPLYPENHVYHLFVIKTVFRNELIEFLQRKEIETLIHYPVPIHKQKACLSIRTDPAGLKNAEAFSETCLSIPCHPQLKENEVSAVISALNQFVPN